MSTRRRMQVNDRAATCSRRCRNRTAKRLTRMRLPQRRLNLTAPGRVFHRIDEVYRNLYSSGMKTTLDIKDSLLADAKALAARQRTSLTRLIEEGLQLRLRNSRSTAKVTTRKIPVFKGRKGRSGLVTGVNPISNKALLDAAGDDA